MKRMVDLRCTKCGTEVENVFMDEDARRYSGCCNTLMEQIWWKRPRGPAQWSDKDAVLVFKGPDGQIRYPGRHDAHMPDGYEKVYLRSLADVNRFEHDHNVVNHVMHYDSNGRAIDDHIRGEKAVH